MRRAILLVFASMVIYVAAFQLTDRALAHGTHCGAPNPPCGARYYAGQQGNTAFPGGFSHGIKGYIRAQNVGMYSTSDFIADYMSMTRTTFPFEWAQAGYREGLWFDETWKSTPKIYTESQTDCLGYTWAERSTPSLHRSFQIHWDGQSTYCAGSGSTVYFHFYTIGGGAPIDVTYLEQSLNLFQTHVEHFTATHMEPNGIQCWGTPANCACSPTPCLGYDMYLWNKTTNLFEQWSATRPTTIQESQNGSLYFHNQIVTYSAFVTTGGY